MKNELLHNISGKSVEAECPEPIIGDIEVFPFKKRMNPRIAVEVLLDGDHVLIDDFYSGGLAVLNELKFVLTKKHPEQSFKSQRNYKAEFRALSHRVLILVKNHKLSVKKAPEIGWLKIFYPENTEFLLPFPQVQGLNSSWQWYQKGIFVPGLQKKIHPYFGTYFPTRFEHLELFNEFLKKYDGTRKTAYDIGIGSGILSFQLLNNGFEKIIATDTNPNSIIGIHEQVKNGKINSRIELFHGDLFADQNSKSDLIVFNPPWIPASHKLSGIDMAIYYEPELFPKFFEQAKERLNDNGRIVLLFSNLAQVTKLAKTNPIEEELKNSDFFEKETPMHKSVGPPSNKTKRNQNWRSEELVELWVIKKKA